MEDNNVRYREQGPQFKSCSIRPLPSLLRKQTKPTNDNLFSNQSTNFPWKENPPTKTITTKEETDKYGSWKVDKARDFPYHCHVGNKHVNIYDRTPADIGHSISNCLTDMSIEALYDNDNAEARAETACNMVLFVRLFNIKGEKNGVLVELQRSRGCSFKYHKVAHCILEAAQGHTWKNETACKYKACMTITPEMKAKLNKKSSVSPVLRKETVEMSLDATLSLLKKDRMDASMLAMESLKLYTDTNSTAFADALIVARKVLCKTDSCNCTDDSAIYDAIVSLIKYWRLNSKSDEAEYAYEKNHNSMMHHHALCVLANSMSVLSRAGELVIALESDKWFNDEILSLLMHDIGNAKVKTHNSYQATRSLNLLVDASKSLKEKALALGVVKLINTAHPDCRHALLASEINAMKVTLGVA